MPPIRWTLVVVTLLAASVAHADDGYDRREIAEQIARGVIKSARRAIAIGPTVGMFSTYSPSPGEFDTALSFGLEVEVFASRILSASGLQELVRERVQAKVMKVISERNGGQRPDEATLKQYAREVLAEVKAELIAEVNAKPKKLQKPKFNLQLEANYMFDAKDWLARVGFGVGIGPVSIGPTFSVRFGDETVARLGGELAVHLMATSSLRSPVLDVFLRGDFELHDRTTKDDQVVLGVRLLLDII